MFNYEKAFKNAQEKRNKLGYDKNSYPFRLKYYKRLGIFKQANGRVKFDPDVLEARSYGHWCFVKVIKGKVVFNNYSYSNTTCKHQNAVWSVMNSLGIKIDVTVNQSESLDSGIRLDHLYRRIENVKIRAARKGARKTTKQDAPKIVASIQKNIKDLKKLGGKLGCYSLQEIKQCTIDDEKYRLEILKRKRDQWKLENADLIAQRKLEAKVKREEQKFHDMVNK